MEFYEIEDLGYVEEMRQRLGVEESSTKMDKRLLAMTPMERVRLLSGWFLGDPEWADAFKEYFESQGLFLTTNEDDGHII